MKFKPGDLVVYDPDHVSESMAKDLNIVVNYRGEDLVNIYCFNDERFWDSESEDSLLLLEERENFEFPL